MPLVCKAFGDIITFTRASSATYFDSAGVLQTATTDTPRFDYDPATLAQKGFLIEEQRTNSFTYSEDFTQAAWTKANSSITGNAIAAPDGNTTGNKIVEDVSTAAHTVASGTIAATAQSYTFSIFAKKAERTYIQLFGRRDTTNYNGVSVDLNSGAVSAPTRASTVNNASTTVVTDVGNGWWRIAMTYTYTTTGNTVAFVAMGDATNTYSYTGDGTSGLYIWGAQLEAGAFATSYIPTTTATVTRSADLASVNTLSPWFNAAEGTLFAEGTVVNNIVGTTARAYADIASADALNRFIVEARSTTSTRVRLTLNNVATTSSVNYNALGTNTKVAGAYGADGATICVAGLSPVTTAGPLFGPVINLTLGANGLQSSASTINGHLRRITYYPRRLTDLELQAITA